MTKYLQLFRNKNDIIEADAENGSWEMQLALVCNY